MHDQNSDEKNLQANNFHDSLKEIVDSLKKSYQYLLNMNIKEKKAISLTLIIMTLCFFLGARDVFLFNHVLCISRDYFEIDGHMIDLGDYIANYIIFLIIWSPAIYLLNLYWNTKTSKFRLSLAYAIGLVTYRLGHNEWGLYDSDNFVICIGTAALFTFLVAALIYFVNGSKE